MSERISLKVSTLPVYVAKFEKKGEYFLCGGANKEIQLWNPTNDSTACIQSYLGHGWEIYDLAIAPDRNSFTSCGEDKAVFLWDVGSGRTVRRFSGHQQRINAVDFNEEATVIASGSYDRTVRLWDVRALSNRLPIQIMEDALDSVSCLKILNDQIIVGSVDGYVRIYDIRKGKMISDNLSTPVTSVDFTADVKCFIASTLDSTVRLFDKSNGTVLNEYSGHVNGQYKIGSRFNCSDDFVIGGSEDGFTYTWDFLTAQIKSKHKGHSKSVTGISCHPSEPNVYLSASLDGTVCYWQ